MRAEILDVAAKAERPNPGRENQEVTTGAGNRVVNADRREKVLTNSEVVDVAPMAGKI